MKSITRMVSPSSSSSSDLSSGSASGNVKGDFRHWHWANVNPPDFQLMIGLCRASQSWPRNICLSPRSVTAKSICSA